MTEYNLKSLKLNNNEIAFDEGFLIKKDDEEDSWGWIVKLSGNNNDRLLMELERSHEKLTGYMKDAKGRLWTGEVRIVNHNAGTLGSKLHLEGASELKKEKGEE